MTSDHLNIEDREIELFQLMKDKSIEDLFTVVLERPCDEKHAAASQLTVRGGEDVFEKAVEFCNSKDPNIRAEGAHVLGQIGTPGRPFKKEATPILINIFINDSSNIVRASAAASLGHIENKKVIDVLSKYVSDHDAQVRQNVAFALGCYNLASVVNPLVELSKDENEEVRSWATFGLGTCIDFDTNKIRNALFLRLSDENPEVRGEALIGLASRKDHRVLEHLKKELSGLFYGNWSVEASELLGEPELIPYLEKLRKRIISEEEDSFIKEIDEAISILKDIKFKPTNCSTGPANSAGQ